MKSSAAGCGLLAVALLLGGCYTVPETGRKSLILPLVNDAAQGAAAFADMKAKQEISKDAEKNAAEDPTPSCSAPRTQAAKSRTSST